MYQTILVPVDGSKRAEAILSHVEHVAKRDNARAVFLKVEEEPVMLDRDEVIDVDKYHAEFEKQKEINRASNADFKSIAIDMSPAHIC